MNKISILFLGLLTMSGFAACTDQATTTNTEALAVASNDHTAPATSKVGVLLASHGSRSPQWRKMLTDLEDSVREDVLADPNVSGIKTAFMEYTEPSIATRMKEFDAEGFTDVIVVPVFLTVSSHSFDDIPTILYQKEIASVLKILEAENIERYQPEARVTITAELDFSGFLRENIKRRVEAMSTEPGSEGVALIAYGSSAYNEEWEELLVEIGDYLNQESGIESSSFGWCGHIVSYKQDSTQQAVRAVLNKKENAMVVPVLVAYDEMFQTDIIGGAIKNLDDSERSRVRYIEDAILPDRQLEGWVKSITAETAAGLTGK